MKNIQSCTYSQATSMFICRGSLPIPLFFTLFLVHIPYQEIKNKKILET